jgi:hypothetical protein
MALEDLTGSGKYIDDLVSANPAVGDDVSEGDDHIRGIKNVLKLTFPSIDGAITATDTELNYVDGVTSAIQTQIDSKTTNATHSGEVTGATALTIADNIVDEANLKVSNAPTNGQYLQAQSGNTGGLTWAAVDALPSQTGNAGKFLTTDASDASWATLDTDANETTKGLYEHAHTIAANYSITSGNNAMSAGPVTINSSISVTVPSGSTWVIA